MSGNNLPEIPGPSSDGRRLPPSPARAEVRSLVRDPLRFFLTMATKYGDVVCYRPAPDTAYLINHPDYVRHVLVDNNRNYSKETYSNQIFKTVVADGLLTKRVVAGDIYQQTRNPMSLGFYFCSLGVALIAGSSVATCASLLGYIPAHIFFLKFFEERELALRFGASYMEYKARVPFLIPKLSADSGSSGDQR
jgi:Phospholipid methyltransferase